MIRVVLDTNIIVSALLQPLGPPAQVFVFAIGGSRDDPKRGYRPCNERNHGPIPEGRFLRLPVRSGRQRPLTADWAESSDIGDALSAVAARLRAHRVRRPLGKPPDHECNQSEWHQQEEQDSKYDY